MFIWLLSWIGTAPLLLSGHYLLIWRRSFALNLWGMHYCESVARYLIQIKAHSSPPRNGSTYWKIMAFQSVWMAGDVIWITFSSSVYGAVWNKKKYIAMIFKTLKRFRVLWKNILSTTITTECINHLITWLQLKYILVRRLQRNIKGMSWNGLSTGPDSPIRVILVSPGLWTCG